MIELEKEEKADQLQYLWMGSNLKFEGIKEALAKLNEKPVTSKEEEGKKLKTEWKRLQAFMGGHR